MPCRPSRSLPFRTGAGRRACGSERLPHRRRGRVNREGRSRPLRTATIADAPESCSEQTSHGEGRSASGHANCRAHDRYGPAGAPSPQRTTLRHPSPTESAARVRPSRTGATVTFLEELAENTASLVLVLLAVCVGARVVAALVPSPAWKESVRFPYDLARFLWRVHRSDELPALTGSVLLVAALYWVSPVDLMPALIPGPALLDDVVVGVLALRVAISTIPVSLRERHCP